MSDIEWMTMSEVIALTGASRSTINRALAQGSIHKFRRGGRVVVRKDEVLAWHRPRPASAAEPKKCPHCGHVLPTELQVA